MSHNYSGPNKLIVTELYESIPDESLIRAHLRDMVSELEILKKVKKFDKGNFRLEVSLIREDS